MADDDCSSFHTSNVTDICAFVKNTSDCDINDGYVNYVHFVYCDLGHEVVAACVILFAWLLFLFVSLASTADEFFCPALGVISKSLRLSQNVATLTLSTSVFDTECYHSLTFDLQGVTFMAFGNGAPDIFSAIAAITNARAGDAGLAIGALFGAGVFVTAVVAGLIAIICPFTSMQRPLLRDVIFYLAAVYWAWYVMWDKKITQWEAAGFIILYVFYVCFVIVGRFINQRLKKHPRITALQNSPLAPNKHTTSTSHNVSGQKNYGAIQPPPQSDSVQPQSDLHTGHTEKEEVGQSESPSPGGPSVCDTNVEASLPGVLDDTFSCDTQPLLDDEPKELGTASQIADIDGDVEIQEMSPSRPQRPKGLWRLFLNDINPVNFAEWPEKRFYSKAYDCFKAPIIFLLKLSVPVVGEEDDGDELRNWNRLLNSLQLVTGPTFAIVVTNVGLEKIGGVFPVWCLVMVIGFILALTVFLTSRTDRRPPYHTLYAFLGFVIAVVWIYSIANEIVNNLQALGVVFDLSNAILGLTFLAWGNSIGDLIADTSMAKHGYPRMGISACFGGPLFNLLIGLGIPFTIACLERGGTFDLAVNVVEMVLASGLTLSLLLTLIMVPLSSFRMTRPYGIMLVSLYVIFLLVAILTEVDVIPNNKI